MILGSNRVTQRYITGSAIAAVQSGAERTARSRDEITTGKSLTRASQDPVGAQTALRTRSDLVDRSRWQRSSEDAIARFSVADAALGRASDVLNRAREISVNASSLTLQDAGAREAMAREVEALRSNLLDAANAQYLGRPVFGGVIDGSKAFEADGSYVGANGTLQRTIGADLKVDAAFSGDEIFGDASGVSMFDTLSDLADAIRSQDVATVGSLGDDIVNLIDRSTLSRAEVGVRTNQVERAQNVAADEEVRLSDTLSKVEDTDYAKASLELAAYELSYQASLAATARSRQTSLLDFLR